MGQATGANAYLEGDASNQRKLTWRSKQLKSREGDSHHEKNERGCVGTHGETVSNAYRLGDDLTVGWKKGGDEGGIVSSSVLPSFNVMEKRTRRSLSIDKRTSVYSD